METSDPLLDLLSKIAIGAVIAIVASIITAIITARLALRRFYSEKWWEKKAEAYSAIIESLHHMKRYYDEELHAAMAGREVPEDREKVLVEESRKAHDELKKRIDIGQFVLSEEAVVELAAFEKALKNATNTQIWSEYIIASRDAIDDTLQRMRSIARADLKGR